MCEEHQLSPDEEKFSEWALVFMEGRVLGGLVTECKIAGISFLRVDLPAFENLPPDSFWIHPWSIKFMKLVTEDDAMRHRCT